MKIKNREDLLSGGDVESKRILIDVAEKTLSRLDSYQRIKGFMRRDGKFLHIGVRTIDLSLKRNVYLLGAGKACNAMAMAVEEILGDYLTAAIVSIKVLESSDHFVRTDVFVGGHPIPNRESHEASLAMLRLVERAGSDDLFFCVMSGGSSALLSCPVDGISLEDEIVTTDVLLKCGANIREINSIRRHISRINGGRLAQRIHQKGAEMIGFAIRDSLASSPTGDISVPVKHYPATPIGCDDTTLDEARWTIKKYFLEHRLPPRVVSYFSNSGPNDETPKDFSGFTYYIINTVPDMCLYAQAVASEMEIRTLILSSFVEGEAREVGTLLASIAREIQRFGHPIAAPCLIISAGEASTKIEDDSLIRGHGGPSQEMVSGFAIAAENIPGAALLSIDSEGTDGTTVFAGGIADSQTAGMARAAGISLFESLHEHATNEALVSLNSGVMTGNTGTNLCDLNLMFVPEQKQ